MYNYTLGRKKSIDPINRILKIILPWFGINMIDADYDIAMNYLSFGFLGRHHFIRVYFDNISLRFLDDHKRERFLYECC